MPPTEPTAAAKPGSDCIEGENGSVNLARIAWLLTTIGCLLAALVALADGYRGYAAVAFAVAASAAINLIRR